MSNKPIKEGIEDLERRRKTLLAESDKKIPLLVFMPAVALFAGLVSGIDFPLVMAITVFSIIISTIIYQTSIGSDFEGIKNDVKSTLIEEFMSTYYPDAEYRYFPRKQQVSHFLKTTKLLRADKHHEEDVIKGSYKGSEFYFSEIHLENENEDSTSTAFRGILFDLTLPGKNFPKTRIQSKKNLLQTMFYGFQNEEKYDLWYDTEDEDAYHETLAPLLPFVSHLSHRQGDVRLHTEGNKITLMMESRMKFLDNPKLNLDEPVGNSQYKTNLARQMNTLLFIVDALVTDLDSSEIEERLELKALETINNPLTNRELGS